MSKLTDEQLLVYKTNPLECPVCGGGMHWARDENDDNYKLVMDLTKHNTIYLAARCDFCGLAIDETYKLIAVAEAKHEEKSK